MTWVGSNLLWSNFDADFLTAIDTTNPAMPASLEIPLIMKEQRSPSPSQTGVFVGDAVVAPRRIRLNRVTMAVTTAAGVTGSGGGTNAFSVDFNRAAPPYTSPTLIETVGPIAMAVGGTGVSADFNFDPNLSAPKGNYLGLSLTGLSTLVLPVSPASTSVVRVVGSAEWEIMDFS